MFAVPFIKSAYIVRAALLSKLTYYDHRYNDQDADVVFCNSVRAAGQFSSLDTFWKRTVLNHDIY